MKQGWTPLPVKHPAKNGQNRGAVAGQNQGDILESYQFMIQESHKKNKLLPVKVQVNTDFWSWNKKITENDEIGRE